MSIPDFQSLMLPLLQLTADGNIHTTRSSEATLIRQFGLSEAEQRELLPSGRQTTLTNRLSWATTYLRKARLLESTSRGAFRITERGRKVLQNPPQRIDIRFLYQFPEMAEFHGKTVPGNGGADADTLPASTQTPGELLEASYQVLRRELAQELLEQIKTRSPLFFEQLVVDLLLAMGYGGSRKDAGTRVGRSGDGGIDGIIKEDKLGLDYVYIQAKRWEGTVGRPVVQAFAGSLEEHKARKGVMISTSNFSQDAQRYVERIEKKIVLIDGEQLAQLLIDYNVGVSEEQTYVVKKIDQDYFSE